MRKTMKISVVINTLNEEKNLSDCLESVKWADEIVVVDMHSEDKTREIAEKYGAKVYLHKKMGYVEPARNFAVSKATGDWILVIDADERVTKELRREIEQTIGEIREVGDNKGYDGYYLRRTDLFLGKWLKYGETANVKIVRLVKKGHGKWSGRIHEQWGVAGRLGELKNPLWHTRPDLRTFIHNLNTYTEARVEDLIKLGQQKPRWRLGIDIVLYPVAKFLQNYFWRKGFLDGEQGLILAILMSFHSFLVRAKLYHATQAGPVASFFPANARRRI